MEIEMAFIFSLKRMLDQNSGFPLKSYNNHYLKYYLKKTLEDFNNRMFSKDLKDNFVTVNIH